MSSKTHAMSIRLPMDLYMDLSRLALAEDLSFNKKLINVLRLGLGQQVNIEATLRRMISDHAVELPHG